MRLTAETSIDMSKFTDQQYLKDSQYKDSSNLQARVDIHKRFSVNPQGLFNWIFDELLKSPLDAKILELGCGPAHMWRECANRIPDGWDITLSDFSAGMLDTAWRNLVVTGRSINFREIDAQEIPFEDNTFDVVMANFMLYHVPDRPKAISEIKRVLKTDGTFIAGTVGDDHMKEMMEKVQDARVNKTGEAYENPFTLQSGMEQLKPYFPNVTMQQYEDSLKVTEVEPIMAYIQSSIRAMDLSENELRNIRNAIEQELAEKGFVFITKELGLFKAIK